MDALAAYTRCVAPAPAHAPPSTQPPPQALRALQVKGLRGNNTWSVRDTSSADTWRRLHTATPPPLSSLVCSAIRAPAPSPVQPLAAKTKAPPVMPLVPTPGGPADLMSAFLRNRIIFVGSTINAQMAQRVISQLIALAAISEEEDIKMYINCPGGSTYSVLAIYDCMAWVKPDISTVGFGMCASQGAFLLAAGAKGKRLAMPNTRIMIHQPQGGCGGTADDVRRQVNEVMSSRDKLDKMFSAFTGQPVEMIQKYTERDRFFSAAEATEFGLIDGVLETEY